MRRLTTAFFLAVFMSHAATLRAQAGFEGVVQFKSHFEDEGERTMVQMSKGSRIRFEQHGDGDAVSGIAIFDLTSHSMVVLLPAQQAYMTMDLRAQAQAAKKEAVARPGDRNTVKFNRTGRTETVAGVPCEIYHATGIEDGKPMEGDACLAKGVGFAMFEVAAALKDEDESQDPVMGMFQEFVRQDLHVIKMTEIRDGKPMVTLEAVKIERKPLDAALFNPPAGFTEMKMPSREQ